MAIANVVKWEVNPAQLAHEFETDDIRLGSQLVVYPSQTALFVKGGRVLGEFESGTYTLKTENLPLLNKLVNLPFGGDSPFQAQVWFVNRISILDCKWGTPSPIQIEDPKYGVIVPIRAFGQYGFHISDPRLFMEKFVGNMSSFTTAKLTDYFRGVILSKLTAIISQKLYDDQLSIINIATHVESISSYAFERLAEVFAAYGVELEMFQAIAITVNESDPSFQRLKETKDALARINIMGHDNYRMERSFNVLDSAASNEGGAVGSAVGIGAGLGLGQQIGAMASQNINTGANNQAPAADTPPPLPGAVQYYIGVNGRQQGPFDLNTIRQAVESGDLNADTLVWRRGMAEWQRMADTPDLGPLFADCPPPLPRF